MDYRNGLLTGGLSGPAVDLQNPEESLLLKALRHEKGDLKMPKDAPKLSDEAIAIFETWIRQGAADPRTPPENAVDPRDHWAFQPVAEPAVPAMDPEDSAAMNEIDAFIHRAHQDRGLSFAPEASRRILARRLAFDLTGLPPDPEVVRRFEQDESPRAYEDLVEKYLADPGFGERWARHWLDVARYADTRGYVFQSERRFPYSYTYRDYVIAAFNHDKPYDLFVMEQLAADRMVEETGDRSSLAALGYLTLGRRFLNNNHDIIDDRIDVTTRGLMGLTVVCARCHDHKYDPIPTADYYSLYGVFDSSTEPSEYPLLDFNANDPKYLDFKQELEKREQESSEFRTSNQREAIALARRQSSEYLEVYLQTMDADGSGREDAARKAKLDPGILHSWHELLGNPPALKQAFWKPLARLIPLRAEPDFETKAAEIIRESRMESDGHPSLTAVLDSIQENGFENYASVIRSYGTVLSKAAGTDSPDLEAVREWLHSDQAPPTIPLGQATRLLDVPTQEKIRRLQRKVEELIATHPGAPPRGMALIDKQNPTEPVIFERGNPRRRGESVPRQFLAILAGRERQPFTEGSGRYEMAREIASPENPLTARVFVNRVWSHLFGQPMVATPSDFGVRSEPPSHPELLDYLASRFMDNGWSIKDLIRLMVTSRTYRQQSFRPDKNQSYTLIDAENRFLWKMNRKRLEFEPMRDQVLFLADRLNREFGGLPAPVFEEPYEPRRTIYGFIERQNLPGVLKTFDFASPDTTSPHRFETTVPQQALFLMNNPWFQSQSRSFADRVKREYPDNTSRQVERLFQLAYQRSPYPEELDWCREFIMAPAAASGIAAAPDDYWQYGTIHLDPETLQPGEFTPFPHFDDGTWKGGRAIPDEKLGWALLRRNGGHPGQNPAFAVSRRWTCPSDGKWDVEIILRHPSDQGDGVRLTVHSPTSSSPLAVLTAANSSESITVTDLDLESGQTIDFVVDCRSNESHDSFENRIRIRATDSGFTSLSEDHFSGPKKEVPPMQPLDQLAQAILMSNETVFVD
jgi:hypothetical protein